MTLIILRVVVGLIVVYFVSVYNVVVMLRNRCKNAFTPIDVQLTVDLT